MFPVWGLVITHPAALQVLQNLGHGGVQTTGNDLKRNQTCFPFALLYVGDVTAIQVKGRPPCPSESTSWLFSERESAFRPPPIMRAFHWIPSHTGPTMDVFVSGIPDKP